MGLEPANEPHRLSLPRRVGFLKQNISGLCKSARARHGNHGQRPPLGRFCRKRDALRSRDDRRCLGTAPWERFEEIIAEEDGLQRRVLTQRPPPQVWGSPSSSSEKSARRDPKRPPIQSHALPGAVRKPTGTPAGRTHQQPGSRLDHLGGEVPPRLQGRADRRHPIIAISSTGHTDIADIDYETSSCTRATTTR